MKFELFAKLYDEAMHYEDQDMYIAERGWQDWMDAYAKGDDASLVSDILRTIYDLSRMDFKAMRAKMGLTFPAFSNLYGVPSRTAQDWEYKKTKMPAYIKKLIAYTMLMRMIANY